jgi:mono/diheme cytochrome c family protein
VQLGSTNWFLWSDSYGNYDGWWYLRDYSYASGRYVYRQHHRYDGAYGSAGYSQPQASNAWRQQVVAMLVQRQASRARIEEAAVDHAAFLETLRATGLQLADLPIALPQSGQEAYGLQEGQQTAYGTAPLSDPFRNLDVEARLVALQRLNEEVAKGTITVSQETQKTLRETLATYERLKAAQDRTQGARGLLQDLRELLRGSTPAKADGSGSTSNSRSEPSGQTGEEEGLPESSPLALVKVAQVVTNHCVECHGPKRAEKGLRLDRLATLDRQKYEAKIVARIFSDDPKQVMPPPSSGNRLSWAQKRHSCRRWKMPPNPEQHRPAETRALRG